MSRSALSVLGLSAVLALALGTAPVRAEDAPEHGSPAPAKPIDLLNTTCPVKDKPVVPGATATVDGMIVHFCCTGCAAKYQASPATYEAALRADAAVAARMDQAHAGQGSKAAPADGPMEMATPSGTGAAFHDAMRGLWEDHVAWTRLFIVSTLAGLPDQAATTKRLLRNQEDIGNGIAPYYGAEAGAKLTALLKEHITTAAELVGALKANASAKAEEAKKKWVSNADDIAAFLSGANPKAWPLEASTSMMREHLDLTTASVAARLKGDWEGDVAAYAKIREQALKMADMLSDGIRRQFPEKFD